MFWYWEELFSVVIDPFLLSLRPKMMNHAELIVIIFDFTDEFSLVVCIFSIIKVLTFCYLQKFYRPS